MRDKHVFQIGRFTPEFRIKIQSTGLEATIFEYDKHRLHRIVKVSRELVRIPTILRIAAIGIDRAKHAGIRTHSELVSE